jgi:hypothetical protein
MSVHALLPLAVNSKSEWRVDSLPPLGFESAIFGMLAHLSDRSTKSHPLKYVVNRLWWKGEPLRLCSSTVAGDNTSLPIPSTQAPLRFVQGGRYGIDATFLGVLLAILVGLFLIILIAAGVRRCFRRDQPRDFCFALPAKSYKPVTYDWGETTFTSDSQRF